MCGVRWSSPRAAEREHSGIGAFGPSFKGLFVLVFLREKIDRYVYCRKIVIFCRQFKYTAPPQVENRPVHIYILVCIFIYFYLVLIQCDVSPPYRDLCYLFILKVE